MARFLDVEHSAGGRAWRLPDAEEASIAELARVTGLSDLSARLLASRGVVHSDARKFLDLTLRENFPDPSSFVDMDNAAEIILDTLLSARPATVFADYDVDGACSAALLIRYFCCWGRELGLYVPDRLREGYGPSPEGFATIRASGAELAITVDCGSNARDALEAAARLQLEVVVLDHHRFVGAPPLAAAHVNPNRHDCPSGQGHLAATAIVFVLLAAVNRLARRRGIAPPGGLPDPKRWLDLCALATVCDVVPLRGFNRALVAAGLKRIRDTDNRGLLALGAVAGLGAVTRADQFGFVLGPRLNAGGRIGRACTAARLLSTDDDAVAAELAESLQVGNDERRKLEARALHEAMAQAAKRLAERPDARVLVTGSRDWHPGVVGIVAGRLVGHHRRPAIAWGGSAMADEATGSGRSVTGVNLGEIIEDAVRDGLLTSGGGHAMAAGLRFRLDRLAALRERMETHDGVADDALDSARVLRLDGVVAPSAATAEMLRQIKAIGPYGSGYPEPVFAVAGARIDHSRRVGINHLAITIRGEDGATMRGIAFGCADSLLGRTLTSGEPVHLAGCLQPDGWRGADAVGFRVVDAAQA